MTPRKYGLQRRSFCIAAVGIVAASSAATAMTAAAEGTGMPHLSADSDETAKLLGYTEDADKAPAARQPGQSCSVCRLFEGGAPYGPCGLYPGKVVSAKGWCAGFAERK